jgi:hypothetical protein
MLRAASIPRNFLQAWTTTRKSPVVGRGGNMLVRLKNGFGAVFVRPERVSAVLEEHGGEEGMTTIRLDSGMEIEVSGKPEEVHAALFPAQVAREAAMDSMRQGAQAAGGWLGTLRASRPLTINGVEMTGLIHHTDVEEALNPRTYADEWAGHTPEQARAMAWALGLVRARLGVELKED